MHKVMHRAGTAMHKTGTAMHRMGMLPAVALPGLHSVLLAPSSAGWSENGQKIVRKWENRWSENGWSENGM